MNPNIETPRLEIVEVITGDDELLYQLTGDKEVMKYFPKVLNLGETKEMVHKILDQYKRYGHSFWKVLLKPKGEFIGIAGLLRQEIDGIVETEISYRIKSEHWNNGYATEAARACRAYAENALGEKRLISIIHPQNHASGRVAQKLGGKKSRSLLFMGEEHWVYVFK